MANLTKNLAIMYRPRFARIVVYMLQATEYQVGAYLKWFWRTTDFSRVMHRKSLVITRAAAILLTSLRLGMLIQFVASILLGISGIQSHDANIILFAVALLLSIPIVWGHLIVVPLLLGRFFIVKPSQRLQVAKSKNAFIKHQALKIAVAGSYGKTTMKEMLMTVLSEGKKVTATPANKNVAISHARFAKTLSGEEDILIIEYGEGAPGDVTRFSRVTKPDIGIITGLAPAHLDKYKTLQKAGEDIFSLVDFLKSENIYVNSESEAAQPFIKDDYNKYNSKDAAGWIIIDVKISLGGTSFRMKKGVKELKIKSQLLGRHQVGPLALVAALADKLGLSSDQIEEGTAKIRPFEHRMESRQVAGAWILDDTYNGNIDGMKAGLQLLKELPAKRKIYITPGLVDQGAETGKIHQELGAAIADTNPDTVVLMKHSVTPDIQKGLDDGDYKGNLIIEDDPLNFYNNLDQFIAAGDLVMMQNDWPDNYN
ncbi:MAG TPA: Mur ligase family protein [Candidatus Saccharimonadales bacterium]|nr:Mur ligase family protein [Candidatus Saccharimonadales bacterium]